MAAPVPVREPERTRHAVLWAILGALVSLLLALWTHHGHRSVGSNDALWYLEQARALAGHWPSRAGDAFPYGYPLLISFGVRAGIPAYFVACSISLLSLFAILLIIHASCRTHLAFGIVAAATVPGVLFQTWAALSDLLFSVLLVAVAVLLAHWPRREAIAASALVAVAAVFVRYVGAFLAPVLVIWFLLSYRSLRSARALWWTVGWGAAALAVALAGCLLNVTQTGHLTGDRVFEPRFWPALSMNVVEFGLSPLTFFSSRLATAVIDSQWAPIAALASLTLAGSLLGAALRRQTSRYSRPLALVIIGYWVLVVLLRSVYDDSEHLWFARFLVPVWFPFVWIALERYEAWAPAGTLARAGRVVSLILVLSGMAQGARGLSAEMYGEVAGAIPAVSRFVPPGSLVILNGRALDVAAYFDDRNFTVEGLNDPQADAMVLAADVTDRRGTFRAFSDEARATLNAALDAGWHVVYSSADAIVAVKDP